MSALDRIMESVSIAIGSQRGEGEFRQDKIIGMHCVDALPDFIIT